MLVVDDSPTGRYVLGQMPGKHGYQMVMAESGEEALEKSRSLGPALVPMNVVMPGLNGFQATRANIWSSPSWRTCCRRKFPS